MDKIKTLYNEELNVLKNLMKLAEEDGRGDKYIKYYKEYNEIRNERDYYLSLYA